MRVIVVDNPFVAMVLELLLGIGGDGGGDTPLHTSVTGRLTKAPDLKANPDFYTKPGVPKALVLKVRSNTIPDKFYDVTQDRQGNLYCTCTGFKYRGKCAHVTKVTELSKEFVGLGMCLRCSKFSRNEANLGTGRGRVDACFSLYTLECPPVSGCSHFHSVSLDDMKYSIKATTKKEMPMTFPVEGTLLQTFQSRHFPEVQYEVKMKDGDLVCTCRGFNFHGTCKHVQYMEQRVNRSTVNI